MNQFNLQSFPSRPSIVPPTPVPSNFSPTIVHGHHPRLRQEQQARPTAFPKGSCSSTSLIQHRLRGGIRRPSRRTTATSQVLSTESESWFVLETRRITPASAASRTNTGPGRVNPAQEAAIAFRRRRGSARRRGERWLGPPRQG